MDTTSDIMIRQIEGKMKGPDTWDVPRCDDPAAATGHIGWRLDTTGPFHMAL